MDRLADVELRLIMHNVDAQSLLRFARCSRMLLHAADARHTWKHTPVALSSVAFTNQRQLVSHPLIRHAPVTLRVAASKRAFSVEDMLLTLARAQIRLFEFDASHSNKISAKQWRMLLAHRTCRQLRVIRMSYSYPVAMDREFWNAFAALPHLHTAALCPLAAPEASSDWHLSNLTCLGLTSGVSDYRDLFLHLDRSRLQRLELHGTMFNAAAAEKYFLSESAQDLQELSIAVSHGLSAPTRAAMLSPPKLRAVELIGVNQVRDWLTELKHAPSLLRLVIAPAAISYLVSKFWISHNLGVNSAAALAELLTALPALHCAMQFTFKQTGYSTFRKNMLEWSAILETELASVSAAFPLRFALSFQIVQ